MLKAHARPSVGLVRSDHEPRSHRLSARLVRSRDPGVLNEEAATG